MKKSFLLLALLLPFSLSLSADECDDLWQPVRVVEKKWKSCRLSDVRLNDGSYFKQMQDMHHSYLLSLDPERLLNNVMRAGGISTTAENYGGWQHNNGNGFGNYMSGCSMMYAATGDETLRDRVAWMIDIIERCQREENLGGWFHFSRTKGFYNSLMAARGDGCTPVNNGEDFYTNSDMAGMVFYQLHRIYYGIRDAYLYAHIDKALDVFLKCMEWACTWTAGIASDASLQMALETEHGGMAELFMDAYALSGDEKFLKAGERWTHTLNFRDRLCRGDSPLTSRHANVYDPKFMGLVRGYELSGDERNSLAARTVWDYIVDWHILPMGGHGRWERYGQPGRMLDQLANTSTETCCTNNMLRFSKAMFSLYGDTRYMDFYERALYNHILASKDPNNNTVGGGFCYFQSLLPGMYRQYMDDSSFYCCWETALENHSKYGEAIYFSNGSDLLVNLFIPSTLSCADNGLRLTMAGNYPTEQTVTLTLDAVGRFAGKLLFRVPQWMDGNIVVARNGSPVAGNVSQGLLSVDGPWSDGDQLVLTLPLALRSEPTEEPDVASIFYGPLLLSPNLGASSGEYTSNPWLQSTAVAPSDFPHIDGSMANPSQWLTRRQQSQIVFRGGGYNFLPFYKASHHKTSIFLRFTSDDVVENLRHYIADRIKPSGDAGHDGSGTSQTGTIYNRNYLQVEAGQSISYTMQLSPDADAPHYVMLQHDGWHTDMVGNYSVYVDDVLIGESGPCERMQQFTFPRLFYKIPATLTHGKSTIRLTLKHNDRPMRYFDIALVTQRYIDEMCPEVLWQKRSWGDTNDNENANANDDEGRNSSPWGGQVELLPPLGGYRGLSLIRLEAEDAQPHGDNRTFDGTSSGGAYVAKLKTYLQYNTLYIPAESNYQLTLCYRATSSSQFRIVVNGETQVVSLQATSGQWETLQVTIHLQEGFNTLSLSPIDTVNTTDIDYVELQRAGDDTAIDGVNTRTNQPTAHLTVHSLGASRGVQCNVSGCERGILRLYDETGTECSRLYYPEQDTFTMSQLPQGIYVVSLTSCTGQLLTSCKFSRR
ncbi:MAG: glycoside hydrolase family 127 protein [Prevotella sp.]|nr:glycoside hydrolase family 127 protein [Prevotella sp.]